MPVGPQQSAKVHREREGEGAAKAQRTPRDERRVWRRSMSCLGGEDALTHPRTRGASHSLPSLQRRPTPLLRAGDDMTRAAFIAARRTRRTDSAPPFAASALAVSTGARPIFRRPAPDCASGGSRVPSGCRVSPCARGLSVTRLGRARARGRLSFSFFGGAALARSFAAAFV